MKIPALVKIIDKNYSVIFDKSLSIEKECAGEIRYRTNEIRLMPSVDGDLRHRESIEYSFFHELVHGILYALNYAELKDDEDFVSRFGRVLYQSLRDSGLLKEDE